MLCKPVVVTEYPTAADLQQNIVEYLHCHDYGNEQEVEKVYSMISVM